MVANLHIKTRIMKKKALHLQFVNLVELFTTVNNMREERIYPKKPRYNRVRVITERVISG